MQCFLEIADEVDGPRRHYLVRSTCSGTSYTVFVSNFMCGWIENISRENLLERCQKLNPLLEASPDQIVRHVLSLLDAGRSDVEKCLNSKEGTCILKLKSKLASLLFKFEFYLEQATGEQFYTQATSPLLLTLLELNERQNCLIKVLKRKDAEIAEYKMNGGQLSRRNLETPVFDEREFAKLCLESPYSPDVVGDPRDCVATSGVRNIFLDVLTKMERVVGNVESVAANGDCNINRGGSRPGTTLAMATLPVAEESNGVSNVGKEDDVQSNASSPEKRRGQEDSDGESKDFGQKGMAQDKIPKKKKHIEKKNLGL